MRYHPSRLNIILTVATLTLVTSACGKSSMQGGGIQPIPQPILTTALRSNSLILPQHRIPAYFESAQTLALVDPLTRNIDEIYRSLDEVEFFAPLVGLSAILLSQEKEIRILSAGQSFALDASSELFDFGVAADSIAAFFINLDGQVKILKNISPGNWQQDWLDTSRLDASAESLPIAVIDREARWIATVNRSTGRYLIFTAQDAASRYELTPTLECQPDTSSLAAGDSIQLIALSNDQKSIAVLTDQQIWLKFDWQMDRCAESPSAQIDLSSSGFQVAKIMQSIENKWLLALADQMAVIDESQSTKIINSRCSQPVAAMADAAEWLVACKDPEANSGHLIAIDHAVGEVIQEIELTDYRWISLDTQSNTVFEPKTSGFGHIRAVSWRSGDESFLKNTLTRKLLDP